MNRTSFLIDGFNLYHSLREASDHLGLDGKRTRWLNIWSFAKSYLSWCGNGAQLQDVYFFTALAKHLQKSKPGVVSRHKLYLRCLESTGVTVVQGRFKARAPIICHGCGRKIRLHEEKETDVSLAVKMFELCYFDACDTVVIVTGDTDLAPAIRTVKRLFPDNKIGVAMPYQRHNAELARIVHMAVNINRDRYTQHQFSDPFILSNGKEISKPGDW